MGSASAEDKGQKELEEIHGSRDEQTRGINNMVNEWLELKSDVNGYVQKGM